MVARPFRQDRKARTLKILVNANPSHFIAFSPKVSRCVGTAWGWMMKMVTPSYQDGSQEALAQTGGAAPLIDAPTHLLWVGFGAFIIIFLLVLLIIIRARVIVPSRRGMSEKAVFEPAGADADITFDDFEDQHADADELDIEVDDEFQYEDVDDAEGLIDPLFADAANEESEPPKKKKGRSPFSNLFSKKPKQKELAATIEENDDGYAEVLIEPADDGDGHYDGDDAGLINLDNDIDAEEEERQRLAAEAEDARRRAEEEEERIRHEARDQALREAVLAP